MFVPSCRAALADLRDEDVGAGGDEDVFPPHASFPRARVLALNFRVSCCS